jgi:hypothetical protein
VEVEVMSAKRWVAVAAVVAAIVLVVLRRVRVREAHEAYGLEPIEQTPSVAA